MFSTACVTQFVRGVKPWLQQKFDIIKDAYFGDTPEAKYLERWDQVENLVNQDELGLINWQAHVTPRWPLYLQAISTIILFSASAYYHNQSCISEKTMKRLRKFDISAIAIMIMGSSTPPIYYTTMCDEHTYYRYFYLTFTCSSCLYAMYVSLSPGQEDFGNIYLLAVAYIVAGLSVLPFFLHFLLFADPQFNPNFATTFLSGLAFGSSFILGAVIYALRFPEKHYKRTFDIWGHSHSIFHTLVLVGAIIAWFTTIKCFHERQIYQCPIA